MDTAEFMISLIVMVATAIAAIAAMFSANAANKNTEIAKGQLEEMAAQRRDDVRPDIYLYPSKNTYEYEMELGYGRTANDQVTFKMLNIGIGPAKIVKCEWNELNFEEWLTLIQPFNLDNRFYELSKSYVQFNEAGRTYFDEDFAIQILPLIMPDNKDVINLPFTYRRFLGIVYQLLIEENIKKEDIPQIELRVTFHNIFNESVFRKFTISPEVFIGGSQTSDGELVNYRGEIKLMPRELTR
ncbi:hypothetical protein ACJA3J_12125 [Halobacillus sp. SY10]|uniref:hypothetical protein n=1 Tax=Halobacillus sp. SY10 TaxID=3381356 RepID=UPI0038793AD9